MKQALSRKNLWNATPEVLKEALGVVLSRVPLAVLLGRRFRRNFRFVEEAQWWSAERAREYQLKAIQEICRLACDRTAYYRRLFDSVGFQPSDLKSLEDLMNLPTIDKHTVIANASEMCTMPVTDSSVDYVSTGGSSGTPLFFYINRDRSAIEYAYLTTSWKRAGFRLGTPLAVFRGRTVQPDRRGFYHEHDPLLRHHYYSNFHMTDENIGRYLDHIARIGPCFLHVYPSSAQVLTLYLQRHGRTAPANIRGILAESETVYPDQWANIKQAFGVRFFSSYGHSEKLVLAAGCEHSTDYHVWPTYGYLELLDEKGCPVTTPGQLGEIVGTGFINTVMPFIRYRTGDYATYVGDRCEACGRQHPILCNVEGRWPAGALVTLNGTLISMTALNVHDDTFVHAAQFQFYQDTPGRAVLRVVPADGFGDEDRRKIQQNLGRKLAGQVTFTIELVGAIPLTPRGKAVYVDQRIKNISVGS